MENLYDYVMENLKATPSAQWPEVSERSGVPLSTIKKIAYKETKDPRVSSLQQLADYYVQLRASEAKAAADLAGGAAHAG